MKNSLEFKVLGAVAGMILIAALLSGWMSGEIQRSTLENLTGASTETTARVVLDSIEATMVEGKADITRQSVANLKKIRGLEEITVVNSEGKEAFRPDAPALETAVLKEFMKGKERLLKSEGGKRIFYMPLKNTPSCHGCHGKEKPILGAVKVSLSFEEEYRKAKKKTVLMVLAILVLSVCFSAALWVMLRKLVITPVKAIEAAAARISEGDLSFDADVRSNDELGRLSRMLKESSSSLGGFFARIKDLSARISKVAENVETESVSLVRGSEIETEAVANIMSSIQEINSGAAEIAENTEALATSTEETSVSMEQMVSSITTVNNNIHDLSTAVESTSSSIEELSATIKEVAANSEELAAAAEETLSAISEITSSVKEVEQNAMESARQSERVTSDAATFGMTSIKKTIEGMEKIKSSVEHTADFIRKLGGRSDEIGKILTVIDDVTDQTTLLALNAAILAAQAGEHGKGFSVVAEEIKDLAERAAFSTQEIAALIQAVQQEVKSAVEAMQEGLGSVGDGFKVAKEAGDALAKILESSKKSTDMSRSIERSTAEQTKAAKLVAEAMERVRNMIDQIANATAEESRGIALIIEATEKMRDVARQVSLAVNEQTVSSKQISQAMEVAAERSQQISRALSEHKVGSMTIMNTVDGVKNIPAENRKVAFRIGNALRDLHKDSELLKIETERFRFYEDRGSIVKLGVLPLESPAVMYRKFSPLAEYLSKKIGKHVELKVAIDFEDALKDLGQNVTQLCAMGASTYIEAHQKYGAQVLVKGLRDGKPYYHSVIITRSDSGIASIKDLKGKTFAFGDTRSTAGYIVPMLMLKEAGMDPSDFRYYNQLGYHDEVAKAVVRGDYDAGAVIDPVAHKYKNEGLHFVKVSEEIPELNVCSNKYVDEKDVAIIKSALVSLNALTPEGSAILKALDEHYTGFMEARDSDYESIRNKLLKLGMV